MHAGGIAAFRSTTEGVLIKNPRASSLWLLGTDLQAWESLKLN